MEVNMEIDTEVDEEVDNDLTDATLVSDDTFRGLYWVTLAIEDTFDYDDCKSYISSHKKLSSHKSFSKHKSYLAILKLSCHKK